MMMPSSSWISWWENGCATQWRWKSNHESFYSNRSAVENDYVRQLVKGRRGLERILTSFSHFHPFFVIPSSALGHGLYWNKGLPEVELSAGLILLKPTVKGFTEHKDLCWFLFYFILFYFIPVIPCNYPLGIMGNFERQSREMPTCASVLFYEMPALSRGKLWSCNVPSNYTTTNQCRSLHPPVTLLYAIENSLYLAQYFLTITVW